MVTRDKRQKKMDTVGAQIQSGQLVVDVSRVDTLKSKDLLMQLQMWSHLKTLGFQLANKELLKGATAAKVGDKKDKIRRLISTNAAVINSVGVRGGATGEARGPAASNSTPSSTQQQDDRPITSNSTPPSAQQQDDSEQPSSSEEELEDTESYQNIQDTGLHPFKFCKPSEVVVVAFAGGVWYPGIVQTIVSPDTAIINYLHPTSHAVPLPECTEFPFPTKEDTMETDATSVFDRNLTCEATSTSCRTFTLSHTISSTNTRYFQFARLYNIPQ